MDQTVPEQPAGERKIRGRRRRGIGGHRAYGVQPAERSLAHSGACRRVPGVETAHEAELEHAVRTLRLAQRPEGARQVQGDGLLAEGRQPGAGGPADQLGVGGGGGGDHHGVHSGAEQLRRRGHGVRPGPAGDGGRAGRVDVRHHQRPHSGVTGEDARVEGTDPAGAEESDAHGYNVPSVRNDVNRMS